MPAGLLRVIGLGAFWSAEITGRSLLHALYEIPVSLPHRDLIKPLRRLRIFKA